MCDIAFYPFLHEGECLINIVFSYFFTDSASTQSSMQRISLFSFIILIIVVLLLSIDDHDLVSSCWVLYSFLSFFLILSSFLPEAEVAMWIYRHWGIHAGYYDDFDDRQRVWLLVVVASLCRLKRLLLPCLRIGVHRQESHLANLVSCNDDRHRAVHQSKRLDRALLLALSHLLLMIYVLRLCA